MIKEIKHKEIILLFEIETFYRTQKTEYQLKVREKEVDPDSDLFCSHFRFYKSFEDIKEMKGAEAEAIKEFNKFLSEKKSADNYLKQQGYTND